MAYKINFEVYSDNFALPQMLLDDDFSQLDAVYLKVALLIFKNANKNYSANLLSNLLNVPEDTINCALRYWIQKGLLFDVSGDKIPADAVVLSRRSQAVAQPVRAASNGELSYLLECMEAQLKRPITSVEHKSIIHILEYIKLPADVVIMAIEYCVSVGKINARYLEKVCANWADNGVTTHELAEQYCSILKQSKQNETKVKTLFGIENRNLIDSEREHINRWFLEFKFDLEMVKLAYEKTIGAINKLSFPYMNKIMASWKEKGYSTANDVLNNESFSKRQSEQSSYDIDEIDKFWDTVPKL